MKKLNLSFTAKLREKNSHNFQAINFPHSQHFTWDNKRKMKEILNFSSGFCEQQNCETLSNFLHNLMFDGEKQQFVASLRMKAKFISED